MPDRDAWTFLGTTEEGGSLFWAPVGTEAPVTAPTVESITAAMARFDFPLPPAPRRFEVGAAALEILHDVSVTATPRFGPVFDPLGVDIVLNPALGPNEWVLYDSDNNEMGRGDL